MISREEAQKRYEQMQEDARQQGRFKPSLVVPEPTRGKRTKPKPSLDQLDSFREGR